MEKNEATAGAPRNELAALVFAMLLPTFVTLVYFVILAPPEVPADAERSDPSARGIGTASPHIN